ncbi:TPA: hypothetical protein ACG62W_004718 [Escherichia coli]|uniref:hypothetical protein n=1 Tax=Escherichia coli TaxID=562 RepID=UPI00248B7CEE|nr:hypothetical protein [Escherichia coli]
MRTITTREQLLINGRVHERIATHIVTGAHGYETLCTNGYNVRYNKAQQLVESCEKIAEGKQPVTCPVCFAIWQDVHRFTHVDFDTQSGKSDFIDTCHSESITGNVSITGKK